MKLIADLETVLTSDRCLDNREVNDPGSQDLQSTFWIRSGNQLMAVVPKDTAEHVKLKRIPIDGQNGGHVPPQTQRRVAEAAHFRDTKTLVNGTTVQRTLVLASLSRGLRAQGSVSPD